MRFVHTISFRWGMKINFLHSFFFSLFIIASSSMMLKAMEEGSSQEQNSQGKASQGDKLFNLTLASPTKSTLFRSDQNGCEMPLLLNSLDKTKKGDSINAALFRLTHSPLANKLKRKALEGVNVTVNVSGKDEKTVKKAKTLKDSGARVLIFDDEKIDLHEKTIAWNYTDANGEKQYRTRIGSQNFTYQAINGGNLETVIYDQDPELHASTITDLNKIAKHSKELSKQKVISPTSPLKTIGNNALVATPQKKTKISSFKFDLNKTLNERIKKADDELYINMFTIDPKNTAELVQAASRGALTQLNVDFTSLNNASVNRDLLKCAALGTKVYVFNHDHSQKFAEKYPLINHAKIMTRKNKDGSVLSMISTQNMTTSNNADINSQIFYPDDKQLAEQLKSAIIEFGDKSVPIENLCDKNEWQLAQLDARLTFLSKAIKREQNNNNNNNCSKQKHQGNIQNCFKLMNELTNSPFYKKQSNKDAFGNYYYNVRTQLYHLAKQLDYKDAKLD